MITQEDVFGIQKAAEMLEEKLDSMPEEDAKEYITQMLIQEGSLNPDGTPKEQIVNGDFFGW